MVSKYQKKKTINPKYGPEKKEEKYRSSAMEGKQETV